MEALECDVCGGEHQTDICPELGLDQQEETNDIATTRARLTLPPSLIVADIYGDTTGMGVVSQQVIPSKTQFGPFEAKRTTHTFADETLFTLKIMQKNGSGITLDTSDENECNWLCLVRAATTAEEQNCIAYQLGSNIYYNTTRDIQLLEELKVWYAPQYAKRMGKSVDPDGATNVMLGQQLLVIQIDVGKRDHHAFDPSYHGMGDITAAAMQISGVSAMSTRDVGEGDWSSDDKVEVITMNGLHDTQEKQHSDSEEILSVAKGETEVASSGSSFQCPRCSANFQTEVNMVKHLRTHLIPWLTEESGTKATKNCADCNKNFTTASAFQRHVNTHKNSTKSGSYQCPDCDYCARIRSLYQKHRVKVHQVDELSEDDEESENDDKKDSDKNHETEVTTIKVETEEYKPPSRILEGSHANSPRRVQPRRSLKGVRTGMEDYVTNIKTKIISPLSSPVKEKIEKVIPKTVTKRGRGRPRKIVDISIIECATLPEKKKSKSPCINKETVDKSQDKSSKEQNGRTSVNNKNIRVSSSVEAIEYRTGDHLDTSENVPTKTISTENELQNIVSEEIHAAIKKSTVNEEILNSELGETATCEEHKNPFSTIVTNDDISAVMGSESLSEVKTDVPDDTAPLQISADNENAVVGSECLSEVKTDIVIDIVPPGFSADNENSIVGSECLSEVKTDIVIDIAPLGLSTDNENAVEDTSNRSNILETVEDSNLKVSEDVGQLSQVNDAITSKRKRDSLESENSENKVAEQVKSDEDDHISENEIEKENSQIDQDEDSNYEPPQAKVRRKKGRPVSHKFIQKYPGGYSCTVCGKKFKALSNIQQHLPAHSSQYHCNSCEKQFTRKETLAKHICGKQTRHVATPVNDKSISVENNEEEQEKSLISLVKRRKRRHVPGNEWTCEICHEKFTRKHLLMDHACGGVEKTGDGKFSCDICKQHFRTLKYLYRHMAMHTDIFRCAECNKCFSRKDSMQRHVLKCCPHRAEEYKIFSCSVCTKAFATKIGLENHALKCTEFRCEKCIKIFVSEEDFNKHICGETRPSTELRTQSNPKFACSDCNKTFQSLNYLRRHKVTHQENFKCNTCDKIFTRNEELTAHAQMCQVLQGLKEYGAAACDKCNLTISSSKEYREHYLKHTHPFKCDKCEKRFVKVGTLHTHSCCMIMNLTCDICSKGGFRNERYLNRHMVTHGPAEFECEYCHKMFYRRDYLNDHSCKLPDGTVVRLVRKNDAVTLQERMICHTCGKSFVSVSNLNKHMRIHGEKSCICHICHKSFHYVNYLREHIASVHENKYRYQCSHCGKMLKSKTGLITHTKQFHSCNTDLYPCPKCGRVFTQKGNMKVHLYSHTTDRKFVCPFCHKTFKYPDQLNRHKLIHTMENKLECGYCDKRFCKPYELRKHIMVFHSGLVYVCEVCRARCGHRHTVIRHYRRKHPGHVHLLSQNTYVDSLLKHITATVKTEPTERQVQETILNEIIPEGAVVSEVTDIEALQLPVTIDDTLPQMAAKALHSLSHTIIDGTTYLTSDGTTVVAQDGTAILTEDGTTVNLTSEEAALALQSMGQTFQGIDGEGQQQTVVILQIVHPDEEQIMEEVQLEA